ncbi:cellulase family glycosylhydrolase [candidate division KSB1 bacterium]|nr:cellulase family glycosylhydrolase [candidate division KSB1 bacterium]
MIIKISKYGILIFLCIWILNKDKLIGLEHDLRPAPPLRGNNPVARIHGNVIDKWTLWATGTNLRGANIYQRRVYPELDGPTFMGSGPVGPPYIQQDFDSLAAFGANYVNISHPGLFSENPPYVLDQNIQDNLDDLLSMITNADMFAVISFRTGPGRSEFTFFWGEDDDWFDASYYNDQVWRDQAAQNAWAEMWRYTALRYRNNPIVAGYDLMVEPNSNEVWLDEWDQDIFYSQYGGTLYDWNPLAAAISSVIRQVDTETPILIGGMGYSAVDWLPYIVPTGDSRTVYIAHQYAPFVYTHQEPPLNNTYPGFFDTDWDGQPDQFNQNWIDKLLATVDDFKSTFNVPVAINEFGVVRYEPGADNYMNDQMLLFENRGLNHALWVWDPYWPEWNQEVDDFNFRHGQNRNNHTDVSTCPLMEVIKDNWGQNIIRPSSLLHQTYYVNNNHPSASDQNPGDAGLPWLTIQHAVESVVPGDTILVQTGTYAGARIENSGTATARIVLKTENGASVLLDTPGPLNKHDSILEIETWQNTGIVAYWIIEGFEVSNSPGWGIDIRNGRNISVRNNHVHHCAVTGIFTAFSDSIIIEQNESNDNGEHGLYCSNSGDEPVIRNNRLYRNYGCGVHMNGDESMGGDGLISDGLVEANIIYENGTGGGAAINMDGVTDTIVRNNLLYDNHAGGIALFRSDGALASRRNRILNNTIIMPEDGRWAINIAQSGCRKNKLFNNILYSFHPWCGSIVICDPPPSGFESDNNIVVDRFSADGGNSVIDFTAWQFWGYDNHSLLATPEQLFIDPAAGDFHLRAGSKAIDAGTPLPDVVFDLEGSLRPDGSGYDIGAYESQTTEIRYEFNQTGWYMVSVAVVPADCSVSELFPEAAGNVAYEWNRNTGSYEYVKQMEPEKGYWLAITAPAIRTVVGLPLSSFTRHFSTAGWDIVGSVSTDVEFVNPNDQPDNSVLLPAFEWVTGLNQYIESDSIKSGHSYWIVLQQECDLTIGENVGKISKSNTGVKNTGNFDGDYPPGPPDINWQADKPEKFILYQNFPNPFNNSTTIAFYLNRENRVILSFYNIVGQEIKNLLDIRLLPGFHKIRWDGTDGSNIPAPSGIYFYRITAGEFTSMRKMVLMR